MICGGFAHTCQVHLRVLGNWSDSSLVVFDENSMDFSLAMSSILLWLSLVRENLSRIPSLLDLVEKTESDVTARGRDVVRANDVFRSDNDRVESASRVVT